MEDFHIPRARLGVAEMGDLLAEFTLLKQS